MYSKTIIRKKRLNKVPIGLTRSELMTGTRPKVILE